MSVRLTPEQNRFAEFPLEPVFCIAPAGCGKTEALAARVAHLVRRSDIRQPQKALALTFSNKAKANLATRLRSAVGVGWRTSADVMNFHGFAARVIQAHGARIGISAADLVLPDRVWYRRATAAAGVTWQNSTSFESAMRALKSGGASDDEVRSRLNDSDDDRVTRFQALLESEGRIDFNDLLRLGLRALDDPDVAALYEAHFAVVLVDEVQDLSWDQYQLVQKVASGRAGYAGDPAQGIYTFAGADAARVITAIRSEAVESIELTACHRSSAVVLTAVNHFGESLGSPRLTCARSDAGPREFIASLVSRSPVDEAEVLVEQVRSLVEEGHARTIGIVSRRSSRLSQLRDHLQTGDVLYEDWTAPTHDAEVVELLYTNLETAASSADDAVNQLAALRDSCLGAVELWDIDTRGEIEGAIEELAQSITRGSTLREAVHACRRLERIDGPVREGIHLLNAHVGKGQEFDVVIVVGLEQGLVPDYRASDPDSILEEKRTLHVMLSRARHALVVTCTTHAITRYGLRATDQSVWWGELEVLATESWSRSNGRDP
jgi:DNA helicase II / ATP-dependent DNA helicase PcrA